MARTRDPKLLAAAAEHHAREGWKRLVEEGRRRDVQIFRTDAMDGPQQFVTIRRGRDVLMHDSEPALRLYLRGAK